jgi:hypothetical protein
MRVYKVVFSVLLFSALYSFLYDNYLYQEFYVKYLPNKEYEVVFPIYNEKGEVSNSPTSSDDVRIYLPVFPRIMYETQTVLIMIVPVLFVLCLLWLTCLFYSKKIAFKNTWILGHLGLYLLLLCLMIGTPFFD